MMLEAMRGNSNGVRVGNNKQLSDFQLCNVTLFTVTTFKPLHFFDHLPFLFPVSFSSFASLNPSFRQAARRCIVLSLRSLNAIQSSREYLEGIWPGMIWGALNTAAGFALDSEILTQTWSQEPPTKAGIWKSLLKGESYNIVDGFHRSLTKKSSHIS